MADTGDEGGGPCGQYMCDDDPWNDDDDEGDDDKVVKGRYDGADDFGGWGDDPDLDAGGDLSEDSEATGGYSDDGYEGAGGEYDEDEYTEDDVSEDQDETQDERFMYDEGRDPSFGTAPAHSRDWKVVALPFSLEIRPADHRESDNVVLWSPFSRDNKAFWEKQGDRGVTSTSVLGGIRVVKLRNEYRGGIALRGSLRARPDKGSNSYDEIESVEGERLNTGHVDVASSRVNAHIAMLKGEEIAPETFEELAKRPSRVNRSFLDKYDKWTVDDLREAVRSSVNPHNSNNVLVKPSNPVIESIRGHEKGKAKKNKTKYVEDRVLVREGRLYDVARRLYDAHVRKIEDNERVNSTFGDFMKNFRLCSYKLIVDSADSGAGFSDTAEILDNMQGKNKAVVGAMSNMYRVTGVLEVDAYVGELV